MRRRARARFTGLADAGAAAVEFALLLPLFAMLTIGTISAGFAFHAWLSVTHGAQESSRFAATLSVEASGTPGSVGSWLTLVSDRAIAASSLANGDGTFPAGASVCVAIVSPTNIPAVNSHLTRTVDSSGAMSAGAAASGPCPDQPTMTGDYVQTHVSEPVGFNYVLNSATITVSSSSVNRFEAVSLS